MSTETYTKPYVGRFCRQHIPTDKVSYDTQRFNNRAEFLEALASWNKSPVWKYWEAWEGM